jgi:hypothetical protein
MNIITIIICYNISVIVNSIKNCDAIGLNGTTVGVKLRLQRSKSTSLLHYIDISYIAVNFIHYPNNTYKCNVA